MSKRIYKFTSAEHTISSMKNKRLKASTICDLNDPFDLNPVDVTDPAIRAAVEKCFEHFWKTRAILCFSRNWDNLLMWSHYGKSHGGVCLGFDVAESEPGADYDTDVHYQPNVLQIRCPGDVNLNLVERMLRTKHDSWSYEQEVRMFVGLNDPPDANGRNWIEFGSQLVLKEVIIGVNCPPAASMEVKAAVESYGEPVELWWAGMRPDAFLLVKQDHPPDWQATVK